MGSSAMSYSDSIAPHSTGAMPTENIQSMKAPPNYNKFVTDVSMYVNQPKSGGHSEALNGKRWYWLNEMSWVPYRDVDTQKLNMAWRSNQKSCMIINGQYRVDFARNNPDVPSGQQYNNNMQNPGARNVVCFKPAKTYWSLPVANQPL